MTWREYVEWLKSAAREPNGVVIRFNNRNVAFRARAKLYRIREEERRDSNYEFDGLTFRIVGGDLVIAQKKRLPTWNDELPQFEKSSLTAEALDDLPKWPNTLRRSMA